MLKVSADSVDGTGDTVGCQVMVALVGNGRLVGCLVMMEVLTFERLFTVVDKAPTELISDSMVLEKL